MKDGDVVMGVIYVVALLVLGTVAVRNCTHCYGAAGASDVRCAGMFTGGGR